MRLYLFVPLIMGVALLSACGGSSSDTSTDPDENGSDSGVSGSTSCSDNTIECHFRSIESISTTSCELSNGSTTTCYELVFAANLIEDGVTGNTSFNVDAGPYCPRTLSDVGGIGIYDDDDDGDSSVFALNASFWSMLSSDGIDVVDDDSDICVVDRAPTNIVGDGDPDECNSVCSEISSRNNLTVTVLIPITPEDLTTPYTISAAEPLGVSLDGVPFAGPPPATEFGGVGDPVVAALDPCGGHLDPSGFFHWHFVPEAIDVVLEDSGISSTEVLCEGSVTQATSPLVGFAIDGYPIYSYLESDNSAPSDLDDCNGHFGATDEYPDGTYHYHATSHGNDLNVPPCLSGASVNRMLVLSVDQSIVNGVCTISTINHGERAVRHRSGIA